MDLTYNRVYPGDCIKGMERLAEGSIDLAFADPPFNIGYDYDVYEDRRMADDYLDWSRRWIAGVKRVLKPTGTFWLAIGDEYAAELKVLCTRDLGLHCRNWVIWFYTFGVHCKQKFTRSHAHLFYFIKDPKTFTFNSLDVRVPSARELVYGDRRADPDGRVPDDTWMLTPCLPPEVPTRDGFVLRPQDIPDRFPPDSDTWYFSRVAGTFAERRGWHGCQMPEQLLGRVIRACSNEGDLVLDPFGGSGTTLAVAKKLNRRYIGFELSKKYAKLIEQRLAKINPGDPLFGPEDAALSAPSTGKGRRLQRPGSSSVPRVSESPIVTKANISLGQIAVANGELATAIAEAFMTAHQGFSADRVLADPSLNDAFLENCRMLGIPGAAKDWNHLLLNVRKRKGLAAIDTSRRTVISRGRMEPFLFASEIAWRKIHDESTASLDEILCDPALTQRFDRVAARIAPGFSPFEYRWAALSVRKDAMIWHGKIPLESVDGTLKRGVAFGVAADRLPESSGHYLVLAKGAPFYVGYSEVLRGCPLLDRDRMFEALKTMKCTFQSERDVQVRVRTLSSTVSEAQAVRKAAERAKLLVDYEPLANVPLKPKAA